MMRAARVIQVVSAHAEGEVGDGAGVRGMEVGRKEEAGPLDFALLGGQLLEPELRAGPHQAVEPQALGRSRGDHHRAARLEHAGDLRRVYDGMAVQHKARKIEGIFYASLLGLAAQVIAVVKNDDTLFLPVEHRLHVPGHPQQGLFGYSLNAGGHVHVPLRDLGLRLPGRASEQPGKAPVRHAYSAQKVEVGQVQPHRAVFFQVHELFENQLCIAWFAVGSETHQLVLTAVHAEAQRTVGGRRATITGVVPGLDAIQEVDNLICPPFTALDRLASLLAGLLIWQGLRADRNAHLLLARRQEMENQSRAFSDLAAKPAIFDPTDTEALAYVTRITAEAIGLRRVSVWQRQFDGRQLTCSDCYDRESGGHTRGTVLLKEDLPQLFEALLESSGIQTESAADDPHALFHALYRGFH